MEQNTEQEVPFSEPIIIGESVTPFLTSDTHHPRGIFIITAPFTFDIDGEQIEGKVIFKVDDATHFDEAPPIRPFSLTTEGYNAYKVSRADLEDVNTRLDKMANERSNDETARSELERSW